MPKTQRKISALHVFQLRRQWKPQSKYCSLIFCKRKDCRRVTKKYKFSCQILKDNSRPTNLFSSGQINYVIMSEFGLIEQRFVLIHRRIHSLSNVRLSTISETFRGFWKSQKITHEAFYGQIWKCPMFHWPHLSHIVASR